MEVPPYDKGGMSSRPSQHQLTTDRKHQEHKEAVNAYTPPPPVVKVAVHHKTLIHALKYNKDTNPDHLPVQWVNAHCQVSNSVTFEQLWVESNLVAQFLTNNGIKKGDRVMIAYPFGVEFLSGFFGCMMAGIIACSVYPPQFNAGKLKAKYSFAQFNNQATDAGAKYALTTNKFKLGIQVAALAGHKTSVKWLATDKVKASYFKSKKSLLVDNIDIVPQDIAFIQYSSGSTGLPKGIVLSHAAVVHNINTMVATNINLDDENLAVSWMPQYHDYGLICFFLTPCYTKHFPVAACSPIDFIRNPLLWADMIDKFKATYIAGPNFAYGLFAKRMKAIGRKLKYGNCILRTSISAEPISPQTFSGIEDVGIDKSTIITSYGLAETCAYFTSCVGDDIRTVDGFVSCGILATNEHHDKFLVIADSDDQIVDDGGVAEIYIRGPDLASGYWGKPELDHLFRHRLSDGEAYFATGDLGMIVDGRLFVVGRSKELIIINGKNIYPTDIERTIEAEFPNHIRPGSTVAFQCSDTEIGIVVELRDDSSESNPESVALSSLVLQAHGVPTGIIHALKKGSVPKTTSGKLRRVETKRRSLNANSWESKKDIVWEWQTPSRRASTDLDADKPGRTAMIDPSSTGFSSAKKEFASFEECLESVLGHSVDMTVDWETNGLTSLMHAELINQVQERNQVQLPVSFADVYTTPTLLKAFIEAASGEAFPIKMSTFEKQLAWSDQPGSLSIISLTVLQFLGVCILFLTVGLSFITAFLVGKVAAKYTVNLEIGSSRRIVTWSWLLVVVPAFFVTLSLMTIVLKWLVVGRYRSRVAALPSVTFLRWWFVDRLMQLWEFWVGMYILDTKLIWIFYRLMGTDIHRSTRIDAFVREFDLISVGKGTTIEHQLRCRKFTAWATSGGRPSLVFRSINIGDNCIVSGMIGPGVLLGDGCTVSKLAAVPEGAQVPRDVIAKGSPAYNAGPSPQEDEPSRFEWVFDLIKLLWLGIELIHFHALLLLAQLVLNQRLPEKWRYVRLLYWILILTLTFIFGVLSSVLMKWILIYRRRPGQAKTLRRRICYWVCDYHYRVATISLYTVYGISRIWNVVLMLHGMDIDMHTFSVNVFTFVPSNVDLVRVRRSFFSTCSFTVSDSDTERFEILDSSIGFEANLSKGIKIHCSAIPPKSEVRESIFGSQDRRRNSSKLCLLGFGQEVSHLSTASLVIICLLPAYEFFMATVYSSSNIGFALLYLTVTIMIQCVCWLLAGRFLQAIVFWRGDKVIDVMYDSYLNYLWGCHDWSMLFLLFGTPFVTYYFRFMGAKVEGELWYFGLSNVYDFPMLTFEDKVLVDNGHISGHFAVFDKLTIAPTTICSRVTMHPGCYALAGSNVYDAENGPSKVFLPVDRSMGHHEQRIA